VEGMGEVEVEEGGWGNHNIGEGEGEGQEEGGGEGGGEEKRRAWLRHALLAPSVKVLRSTAACLVTSTLY